MAFGSSSATKAGAAVARLRRSGAASGHRFFLNAGGDETAAIKNVVDDAQRRTAARLFTADFPVVVCGLPGGMPCDVGTPQATMGAGFNAGLSGLGAVGCQALVPLLEELQNLIGQAKNLNGAQAAATSAQAVYDDINGYVLYLPFGNDCERHSAEVRRTNSELAALIQNLSGRPAELLRPNAEVLAPEETGLPTWGKVVIGIGVAGLALGALGYAAGNVRWLAPRRSR